MYIRTHTLSLSLSLSHTHMHTHRLGGWNDWSDGSYYTSFALRCCVSHVR
jgi:hypothetical protein